MTSATHARVGRNTGLITAIRLDATIFVEAAPNVFASSKFFYLPFVSRLRKGATIVIASNIRMADCGRPHAQGQACIVSRNSKLPSFFRVEALNLKSAFGTLDCFSADFISHRTRSFFEGDLSARSAFAEH